MSKFFENLANVGSAAGGVGSLVSGVASLFGSNGAKQQYEYQRKLNEQQQQYARENSLLDYQRTRELTADKFQLEKQGKRAAGISTSFTDGSSASAAAVNGVAAPNAGSISLAQNFSERMAQSASMLSSGASLLRENMLAQRQSENLALDANLKRSTMLYNIQRAKGESKSAVEKSKYDELQNEILEDFGYRRAKAQTEDEENKAGMSSIQYKYFEQMTLADLQNKLADTELKLKNRDLSDEQRRDLIRKSYVYKAEIKLKEEQAKVVVPMAQSQIGVAEEQKKNIKEDTRGKRLSNDVSERLQPYQVANMIKDAKLRSLILDNDLVDQSLRIKYGSDWRTKLMRQIEQHESDMISHGWNSNDWAKSSFKQLLFDITDLLNGSLGSLVQSIGK